MKKNVTFRKTERTLLLLLIAVMGILFSLLSQSFYVSADSDTEYTMIVENFNELFTSVTLFNSGATGGWTKTYSGADAMAGSGYDSGQSLITVNARGVYWNAYYQEQTTTALTITAPENVVMVYTWSDGGTTTETSQTYAFTSGDFVRSVTSDKGTSSDQYPLKTGTLTIKEVYEITNATVTLCPSIGNGSAQIMANEEEYDITSNGEYGQVLDIPSFTQKSVAPLEGYQFIGWNLRDENGGSSNILVADENGLVELPIGTWYLSPVFVPEGSDAIYEVNGERYYFLDEAERIAYSSSKQITLVGSGNVLLMSGTEATIRNGVTFVLPYKEGVTEVKPSSDDYPYANYTSTKTSLTGNSSQLDPNYSGSVSYTLTVPEGITVVNNGILAIGGTIQSNGGIAGATCGVHANLQLEGTLEVGSTGILSVCGYILGEGAVDASAEGAQVYQPFVICDYRGGGYTVCTAGQSAGQGLSSQPEMEPNETTSVAPFNRYTMRNIQAELILGSKAVLYGYCDLYTQAIEKYGVEVLKERHNQTCTAIAGAQGLLVLSENATMTVAYHADETVSTYKYIGKTVITVEGGASFNAMSLTVSVASITATVKTSDLVFSIPYNYSIFLNAAEGQESIYTLAYPIKLLPGAELIVGENAVLNVSSTLAVYDELTDLATISSADSVTATKNQAYPDPSVIKNAFGTSSARLLVRGTLHLIAGAKFGGLVQTDGEGSPKIVVDEAASLSATVQTGGIGEGKVGFNVGISTIGLTYYFAGATVRTLDAQIYNGQEFLNLKSGKTYYGYENTDSKTLTGSYDFYNDCATTKTQTETFSLEAPYQGAWYTLLVYANAKKTEAGLDVAYRLDNYIWLNATFYLGDVPVGGTVSVAGNEVITERNNLAVVSVGDDNILVCKVHSDQIVDKMAFTVIYTVDGETYTSAPITVSFKDYAEDLIAKSTDETQKEFLKSMITYGEYAKVYFNPESNYIPKNQVDAPSELEKYATGGDLAMRSWDDSAKPKEGASISSKGINFYFGERISLMYYFALDLGTEINKNDIVQIGLLTGDASATSNLLTTDTVSGKDAYLLYNQVPIEGDDPSQPEVEGFSPMKIYTGDLPDTFDDLMVSFDLTSLQYSTQFNIRAFAVVRTGTDENGGTTYAVIYGKQYTYGLKNYIARQHGLYGENFENFLYATWAYADAAKTNFGSN